MRKIIITIVAVLGLFGLSACSPADTNTDTATDTAKSINAVVNEALGKEKSDVKVVPWNQHATHEFTSEGVRMKSKDGETSLKSKDEQIVTKSSVLAETQGASLDIDPMDTRSIKTALSGTKSQWKDSQYVIVLSQGDRVHGVYRADDEPNVKSQDDMTAIRFADGENRFTVAEAGFDYMIVKVDSL